MKKLMLAALICLLCGMLSACASPASSPGGELGGLTRISLKDPAGISPAGFSCQRGGPRHYICQLDTFGFSG